MACRPRPPRCRPAASEIKEAIFHAYPRSPRNVGPILGRSVRTERYRLVEWKKPGTPADTAELELYGYQTDPAETKNLVGEQPNVVAKLRALLAAQPEAKPQIVRAAAATANRSGQDRAGLGEKVGTIRGRQFPRGEVDGIQVFQNTFPLLHAWSVTENDHRLGKNSGADIHGFSGVSGGSGRPAISSNSRTRATAQCRRMVGSLTPSTSAIS